MPRLINRSGSTWPASGDGIAGNLGLYGLSNTTHVGSTDIPAGSVATGYLESKDAGVAVTLQVDNPNTVLQGAETNHFVRVWVRAVKTGTLAADATQSTLLQVADPGAKLQAKLYLKSAVARNEGFGLFCAGGLGDGVSKGLAGCDPVIAVPQAAFPLDTWCRFTIRTVRAVAGGIYLYLNNTLCAKYTGDTTAINLADMQGDWTWIFPTLTGIKWQIVAPIESWTGTDIDMRPMFSLNAATDLTVKAFLTRFPTETLGAFFAVTGTASVADTLLGNTSHNVMRARFVASGSAGQTMTLTTIDKIGTLPYDSEGWATLLWPNVYIPSGGSFTLTINDDAGSPLVTLTCDGANLQQGGSTVLPNWIAADRYAILLQLSSAGHATVTLRNQTKMCSANARCAWSAALADWTPQALGTVSLALVLGSGVCDTEGMDVCRRVFTFGIDSLSASQHTAAPDMPELTDAYLVSGAFCKGEQCFSIPGGSYPFRSSAFPRHRVVVLFGNSGCRTSQWMSYCYVGMSHTRNLYFVRADLGSVNDISDGVGAMGANAGAGMTVAQRDSLVAGLVTSLVTSTAALLANGNIVVLTSMLPREMDGSGVVHDEMQRQAAKVYGAAARRISTRYQTSTSLLRFCDFEAEIGTPLSLFTTGDSIHPNAAGAVTLATLLATRITTPLPEVYLAAATTYSDATAYGPTGAEYTPQSLSAYQSAQQAIGYSAGDAAGQITGAATQYGEDQGEVAAKANRILDDGATTILGQQGTFPIAEYQYAGAAPVTTKSLYHSLQTLQFLEGTGDWVGVDLTSHLRETETIDSVGTPVEYGTSDLTITNVQVTTVPTVMCDNPVPAGKGILFRCSGWLANNSSKTSPYQVKIPYVNSAGSPKAVIVKMYAVNPDANDSNADSEGSGAVPWDVLVEASGIPIGGVVCRVSSDAVGTTMVAGPVHTDSAGLASFMLNSGTYYLWREHSRYEFPDPVEITIP